MNTTQSLTSLATALAVACVATTADAQTPAAVQWPLADGGNGHWYGNLGQGGCWPARRDEAASIGGHLATAANLAEVQWIYNLMPSHFLFGGYRLDPVPPGDPQDGWRWSTNEPFLMELRCPGWYPENERWASGSPNLNCVGETGQCDNYQYPIEWDADCNNDGIVDYGQCHDGSLVDANANNIPDCCENGAPCAANLLANGGFEAGPSQADCSWVTVRSTMTNLAPWAVVDADVDRCRLTAACTNESWQSIEGEFSVDLDGSSSGGAIQQSISTVVGQQYLLTFEMTGNCGGSSIRRLRATAAGSSADFMHPCQPGGLQSWSICELPFTATTSTTAITLASQTPAGQSGGANGAVVDDVRVTRFDPPCPGDISGNGAIDGVDITVLLGVWGTDGTGGEFDADITNDGIVNGADLTVVLGGWGACP